MSDEDHIEHSAGVMNQRALIALLGGMATGPSGVGREIINLLRSPHLIAAEVRDALADAIERGLFGNQTEERNEFGQLMPWLEVGGMLRDGRVGDAIAVRRNWFNAAEELKIRRSQGERGYRVMEQVGAKFGLGIDAMKNATKFRNRFLREINTPGNNLVSETLNYHGDNEFDPDMSDEGRTGGDHYFYARSLFIEREAEATCKKG